MRREPISVLSPLLILITLCAGVGTSVAWPSGPFPVGDGQVDAVFAVEGGGAILVHSSWLIGHVAQRLDADGAFLWGSGVQVAPLSTSPSPALASDGARGLWVGRVERLWPDSWVSVRHVDGDGVVGEPVTALTLPTNYAGSLDLISDRNGGVFVIIYGDVYQETPLTIQHLDSSGALAAPTSGVVANDSQRCPQYTQVQAICDAAGDLFLAWTERSDSAIQGLRAQKMSDQCTSSWQEVGLPGVGTFGNTIQALVPDDAGGSYFLYASESVQRALHVDESGAPSWAEPVTLGAGYWWRGVSDSYGGIYALVMHGDCSATTAHVQHINQAGTLGHAEPGIQVASGLFCDPILADAAAVPDSRIAVGAIPTGSSGVVRSVASDGLLSDPIAFAAPETWFTIISMADASMLIVWSSDDEVSAQRILPQWPTSISESNVPARFDLGSAVPNPFNPHTLISFSLEMDAEVELVVYDLSGHRVKTLFSGNVEAGRHEALWDGRDDAGHRVSSGMYLYQMVTGGVGATKRVVLLK